MATMRIRHTLIGVALATAALAPVAQASTSFVSPTGNIKCVHFTVADIGQESMDCVTFNDHFWVTLNPRGRASGAYARKVFARGGRTLGYGRNWYAGNFGCSMHRAEGVVCFSFVSGYGFQLNAGDFNRLHN
jgi:hypothetical protein